MSESHLSTKLLILETDARYLQAIRRFCDENGLVAIEAGTDGLAAALASHIDLGAILCSEDFGGWGPENTAILLRLQAQRPELPIILRRDARAEFDGMDEAVRAAIGASYPSGDMDALRAIIEQKIFNLRYPKSLLDGIPEITRSAIASQLKDFEVVPQPPYVVHDRLMFGEALSLIPLESAWCRGYMMMQAEAEALVDALALSRPGSVRIDFRTLNSLLGEITNLVWGAFKNRYIGDSGAFPGTRIQVPLLINRTHGYISFGTDNPQLCFRYALANAASGRTLTIDQRFVFNLHWAPEDIHGEPIGNLGTVDSGELEMF